MVAHPRPVASVKRFGRGINPVFVSVTLQVGPVPCGFTKSTKVAFGLGVSSPGEGHLGLVHLPPRSFLVQEGFPFQLLEAELGRRVCLHCEVDVTDELRFLVNCLTFLVHEVVGGKSQVLHCGKRGLPLNSFLVQLHKVKVGVVEEFLCVHFHRSEWFLGHQDLTAGPKQELPE